MAKSFDLRVKLLEIKDVEEVGNNGFKKREVIGVVEGEYPDYYKFEFTGSKIDEPEDFLPGTYANITFNLGGKKVESKQSGKDDMYFVTLRAWKIEA